MPRNRFGGKKHKKHGNKKARIDQEKGVLRYAEKNQVYAIVVKRVGGSRLNVDCSDGKNRSAIISGKFRRRVWMNAGDILLCELGTTGNDDECTAVHKYTPTDARALKSQGLIDFGEDNHDDEVEFEFTDETQKIPEQQLKPDLDDLPSLSDDDIDLDDL